MHGFRIDEVARPEDDVLVFPGDGAVREAETVLRRVLYPAYQHGRPREVAPMPSAFSFSELWNVLTLASVSGPTASKPPCPESAGL